MKKTNFLKQNRVPILAFLIAFLPRLAMSLCALPLRTVSDEFNTMAVAALACGKNWSEIVSNGGYYGFGYTVLYAPLFYCLNNPVVLYRTILVIESLLQASVALIACYLLRQYFKVQEEVFLLLASVSCSYMVVTRAMLVFNEHGLIFCSWLLLWLLLRLVNEQSKRRDSVLLMLLLSYMLTMHTRAWIYWIALACVMVLYGFFRKKWLLSPLLSVLTAAVSISVSQFFIKYVQRILWQVQAGETIRNSSLKMNKLDLLTDIQSWHAWLNTIMGLFNSFAVISGGLLIMGFVLLVYFVYRLCLKKFGKTDGEELDWNRMVVIFYFTLITMGTVLAMSIRWLPQTMEAMLMGVGSMKYGLKSVTYVRYAGPYFGPLLLGIFACLYGEQQEFARLYKYAAYTIAGLQIFWTCCILPYVYLNNQAIECYLPFSFQARTGIRMGRMVFMPAGVLLIALTVLFWILFCKKKKNVVLFLLAVLLIYEYSYNSLAYDLDSAKNNAEKIDASYELLYALETKHLLPVEEIYVADLVAKGNHQIFYLMQFYLNDLIVHPYLPKENLEEALVITNAYVNDYLYMQNGYKCAQIDADEFIWVKGERLQQLLEGQGILFE